jgi:hypothetical protein
MAAKGIKTEEEVNEILGAEKTILELFR